MIFKQGRREEDALTFWADDDTDTGGVFGVLLDGMRYDGDTLSASTGYMGIVRVANVSKGAHTVQPLLDGVTIGPVYNCKTRPVAGGHVKLLFTGDANKGRHALHRMAHKETDADAMIATEMNYIDSTQFSSQGAEPIDDIITDYSASTTANGGEPSGEIAIFVASETGFAVGKYATITLDDASPHVSKITFVSSGLVIITTGIPAGRTLNNGAAVVQSERYTIATSGTHYDRFLTSYRLKHRYSITTDGGRAKCFASIPTYKTWNNHEFDSDVGYMPLPGSTQYEAAAKAVHENYRQHCVPNNDSDIDNTPTQGVFYWAEIFGDVHVIMCDQTSYSDVSTKPPLNGENNTISTAEFQDRGQNKQLTWTTNQIDNSTSKVIAVYLPSTIQNDFESVDATVGILKHLSLRADAAVVVFTADSHHVSILNHAIHSDNLLEIGCSALDNPTVSGGSYVSPTGVTTLLWDDAVGTGSGLYENGTLGAHEMNMNYTRLEYHPNGTEKIPVEHVELSLMRATDTSIRKTVRLTIGQHQPTIEKRLPAAVTIY